MLCKHKTNDIMVLLHVYLCITSHKRIIHRDTENSKQNKYEPHPRQFVLKTYNVISKLELVL